MKNKFNRVGLMVIAVCAFFVSSASALQPAVAQPTSFDASAEAPQELEQLRKATEASPADAGTVSVDADTRTPEEVAENPVGAATELGVAVKNGDWRKTAALALSLLMFGLARFRKKIPLFKGDRGGVFALFTLSAGGALATSLLGSAPVDLEMFIASLDVGLLAIGGFTVVKKLFWPADKD